MKNFDKDFERRYKEAFNPKGNVMNDDKLECLRLATDFVKTNDGDILTIAKKYYEWVYEHEKPNSLTFEKISKERE